MHRTNQTQRPYSFFRQLGYQRNPFGALTAAEWAAVAVLPQAVAAAVAQPGHLQLLGPMGIGKSSTLRGIAHQLLQRGQHVAYEYIPEGQQNFLTNLNGLDVFCLDEAQRLNWRQRRQLRNWGRNGRLIFGTHKNISRLLKGQLLTTIDLTSVVDAAHWRAVLTKRLDYFALPNVPTVRFTEEAICYLAETFGPDLREGEYFLYEVWQQQQGIDPITADQLQNLYAQYSG